MSVPLSLMSFQRFKVLKVLKNFIQGRKISTSEVIHLNEFSTAAEERTQEPAEEDMFFSSELERTHQFRIIPDVERALQDGVLKHRKHPGARGALSIHLPERLIQAAKNVFKQAEHPMKVINRDGRRLLNQLHQRKLPATDRELRAMTKELAVRVRKKDGIDVDLLDEVTRNIVLANREQKVKSAVECRTKNWKPMEWSGNDCLAYLHGCFASNYATMCKIFQEIKRQVPDYKPKTLLDFGSGVGSTLWALNEEFPGDVKEALCIDCSQEMNDLARLLLQDGKPEAAPWLKNLFFKPYLPPSNLIKYNMVVCAHALMDTPTSKERVRIINNLWNKTEDMLVIVEHGSLVGHSVVIEARDYILQRMNTDPEKKEAFVLAPCPHDLSCPRMKTTKKIPCNSPVTVQPLLPVQVLSPIFEKYSYVVLSKKQREIKDNASWPRLISPMLKRKKHLICKLCNNDGELYEAIIGKKRNGKDLYRCARRSHWGDAIPAVLAPLEKNDSDLALDNLSGDSSSDSDGEAVNSSGESEESVK